MWGATYDDIADAWIIERDSAYRRIKDRRDALEEERTRADALLSELERAAVPGDAIAAAVVVVPCDEARHLLDCADAALILPAPLTPTAPLTPVKGARRHDQVGRRPTPAELADWLRELEARAAANARFLTNHPAYARVALDSPPTFRARPDGSVEPFPLDDDTLQRRAAYFSPFLPDESSHV